MAGDWKYKIVEIAEDMAGDDGLDYGELSESEQMKYYKKAYDYYLDRDVEPMAKGGIMRAKYAYGTDDDDIEEIQEDETDIIELMKDQGVPYGEQVKSQESGIMQMADEDPLLIEEYRKYVFDMQEQGLEPMTFEQFKRDARAGMASNINPEIRIEEVVKEFIRERGRKPNSLEELKEFYEMRIGTAKRNPEMDVVNELVEEDKTRITLAGGNLVGGQVRLDVDGDGSIGADDLKALRDNKQSGGLAAILGV
jgi:hypothetical protein